MSDTYRWVGLDELERHLRKHWDNLSYLRLVPLCDSSHQKEGFPLSRLDIDPDGNEELRELLEDGTHFDLPTPEALLQASLTWVKNTATNLLIEFPPPARFKVFLGGLHSRSQEKRDLTSVRLLIEAPTRALPPELEIPPGTSPLLPDLMGNLKTMIGLMTLFSTQLVQNSNQLNASVLENSTRLMELTMGQLKHLSQQLDAQTSRMHDLSNRLFQRADEQQQRVTQEQQTLHELKIEEQRALMRTEIGKEAIRSLSALGQTWLGGKAVPPELLELLPVLPPEVLSALTDPDVLAALKQSAELRAVLVETVNTMRATIKAAKASS